MSAIIPRPLRDIIMGPFDISESISYHKENGYGCVNFETESAAYFIRASIRTALAGLAVFALFRTNFSQPVSLALCCIASMPSTLVLAGGCSMYHGTMFAIKALSLGSFATFGMGVAGLIGGYFILENYTFTILGLAESCVMYPMAEKLAPGLVKLFEELDITYG